MDRHIDSEALQHDWFDHDERYDDFGTPPVEEGWHHAAWDEVSRLGYRRPAAQLEAEDEAA